MNATDLLLQNNRRYALAFDQGGKPAAPAREVAILTCMDARIHPERLLGLEIGDAHVVRNAGGLASDDAVRSLIISCQLLGVRECLVIHHTDCGMLGLSNDDVRSRLAAQTGADASHVDFLPFADLEESVRDDVRRLSQDPLLPADLRVAGYVYDVDTGALAPVAEGPAL